MIKAAVKKPFFMRLWERYPKTWKLIIDAGILIKYKTLNIQKLPNRVVLPSSNILFVNPNENRGRAILIKNGVTQERLFQFWRQAVTSYHPTIVIDVGINYGECIFSTNYHKDTKVYGIEANRQLISYIHKSREVHKNRSQINIIHAFASDLNGHQKDFYVDKHWSGTSSAAYLPSHNMIEKVGVGTIKVDSLFEGELDQEHVLFKVDVEGYEAFVLKGMEKLFQMSHSAIGFIEFNGEYIEKSGTNIDEFLLYLQRFFTIYIYTDNETLVRTEVLTHNKLKHYFDRTYVHTDLILTTDTELISCLHLPIDII